MPRYIDVEKLLWLYEHECEKYSGLDEMVADVPTADVRENVHGKWIKSGGRNNNYRCSRCLKESVYGIWFMFCPICGADMRERRDDGEVH